MVKEKVIKDYIKACEDAALYDAAFDCFKRDPRYTAILEHVNKNIAINYLEKIVQDGNDHLIFNGSFFDNDKLGDPEITNFQLFGLDIRASNSTIQYIGVLSNLIKKFGSLEDFRIVEIGGGYGGQCKIIQDQFKISSYDIFDLPQVNLLQEKYLKILGQFKCVEVFSELDFAPTNYDLVISNYALSEILEPLQTEYVEKILLNSKHGYITCNGEIKAINKLKEKFPTFEISSDIKGERKDNFIITW